MPFFIKHGPKTLWDVYLVEADSLQAVVDPEDGIEEELLGDFIEPSNGDSKIFGPYETKEEALSSDYAWVE